LKNDDPPSRTKPAPQETKHALPRETGAFGWHPSGAGAAATTPSPSDAGTTHGAVSHGTLAATSPRAPSHRYPNDMAKLRLQSTAHSPPTASCVSAVHERVPRDAGASLAEYDATNPEFSTDASDVSTTFIATPVSDVRRTVGGSLEPE
jgi:hypothetical protein